MSLRDDETVPQTERKNVLRGVPDADAHGDAGTTEVLEWPACLGDLAPMSIPFIVSRYPSLTQDEKYDLAQMLEAKVLMHRKGEELF